MSSDAEGDTVASGQSSSENILRTQIESGLHELNRKASGLFLSSLSAGLDIGFGPLLMVVILTMSEGALSGPVRELLMATAYATGFMFVILGQTELFTEHTTLAVIPVLDGSASVSQLGRLWGLIYVGNVVGGAIFTLFAVPVATGLGIADPSSFGEVATRLIEHGPLVLLGAGVLAGWLMGLLSWLVTASNDTVGSVIVIYLVAGAIGFMHLPHSIAGNVEVFAGVIATNEVTLAEYGRFLLLATVGNAIGGTVFVSLLKHGHVVRGGS